MMLEVVVFAVTLVVAQTLASFIVMKITMSEKYLKKCYKKMYNLVKETLENEEFDV